MRFNRRAVRRAFMVLLCSRVLCGMVDALSVALAFFVCVSFVRSSSSFPPACPVLVRSLSCRPGCSSVVLFCCLVPLVCCQRQKPSGNEAAANSSKQQQQQPSSSNRYDDEEHQATAADEPKGRKDKK